MAVTDNKVSLQVNTGTRSNKDLALLQAGSTVFIEISTPTGQKVQLRSIFIGYLPQEYILLKFPEVKKLDEMSHYIKEGSSITVRGLIEGQEGAVLGFVTTIKQTLLIPSKILLLELPKKFTLQYLLSSIRIDTKIKATVKIDQDHLSAMITNLSITGGQLTVDSEDRILLPENKTIEIVASGDENSEGITLNAVICNIRNKTNSLSFGVKFNEEHKAEVVQLMSLAMSDDKLH